MSKTNGMIDIIWSMQNELRNKEGITGMDSMHHVNMVLLSKSFTKNQCQKLDIPEEFAFENVIKLNRNDLYDKFYNPRNSQNCIIRYLRDREMFGYTKDLPFQIKNTSTLEFMFNKVNKITSEEIMNTYDLIGDIYEHFINREGNTMKDLGQYFTDRSLIRYIVQLCDPKLLDDGNIPSVWDPASGTGGFIIEYIYHLNKQGTINWKINKSNLYANDINKNTFSLLKQNLYYSLTEASGITIKLLDSLVNDDDNMYDFIIGNPPFGVKNLKYTDMCQKIKDLGIKGTKGEILFLQLCMAKLKKNGKCAIVIPEGVLFNSTKMYLETRKYLINNFNLKKVIKVGDGDFFKNTGVKTSVLYFENNGKTENVEFVQVNKNQNNITEIPMMNISIDRIIEKDYSLYMNSYKDVSFNVNSDFDIVEFGTISTNENYNVTPSSVISENGSYPYFTSSKSFKLTDTFTEEGEYIIKGTHGNIEDTVHYINGKFACGNNLLKIKINENINTKFIYYYFKLNKEIFEFMGAETIIKFISYNELSKSKIILPSLEEQNRIVKQLDNIFETEINSSKILIQSLQESIKNIMNNTKYIKILNHKKIEEVCNLRKGQGITKINRTGGEFPYYGSNGHSSNSYMNKYNIEGKFILSAEDGTIGSVHYIDDGTKIWVGDHVHVITPSVDNLDIKYLYQFLNNNIDYDIFTVGAVIPRLNKKTLKNIEIYIPSLDIQNEILQKINSKETLIQDLKNNIDEAENQAKDIMNILFTQDT